MRLAQPFLYRFDFVDLVRQFLVNLMPTFYHRAIQAFQAKNLDNLLENAQEILDLLLDLDSLLGSHSYFLLGSWLRDSKSIPGFSENEQKLFEFNARNQVTLWGPQGQILDYATKQWNGLVRDYYYPRWKMFLDYLSLVLIDPYHYPNYNQTEFENAFMVQIGIPFTQSNKVYSDQPMGNPIQLALQIHAKWRPKVEEPVIEIIV